MNDLLVAQQARPFRLVLIRLTVMAILAAATCLTLRLTGACLLITSTHSSTAY